MSCYSSISSSLPLGFPAINPEQNMREYDRSLKIPAILTTRDITTSTQPKILHTLSCCCCLVMFMRFAICRHHIRSVSSLLSSGIEHSYDTQKHILNLLKASHLIKPYPGTNQVQNYSFNSSTPLESRTQKPWMHVTFFSSSFFSSLID